MDRAPGRDGPRDQHGRTSRAAAILADGRSVPPHLWRRRLGRRRAATRGVAPRLGQARHDHRRQAPLPVRGTQFRRGRLGSLHREAADRRGLDQWRLHGSGAGGPGLHLGRRDEPRSRMSWRSCPGRAGSGRTDTKASGSRWTPCATSVTCGHSGPRRRRPGPHGCRRERTRALGRTDGSRHRSRGLSGGLGRPRLARIRLVCRRAGHRLGRPASYDPAHGRSSASMATSETRPCSAICSATATSTR